MGEEAYDRGAEILRDFFHIQCKKFLSPDLNPLGKKIIDCCLSNGTLDDYNGLIEAPPLIVEE